MSAMFGGIVGQEACSGKFPPLFQFFYFDYVESLPTEPLDPNDLRSLNSCYDAQISVFGLRLQQKLEYAKVFVVGSGALGCSNGYSISYGSCMLYNCMFQRHAWIKRWWIWW